MDNLAIFLLHSISYNQLTLLRLVANYRLLLWKMEKLVILQGPLLLGEFVQGMPQLCPRLTSGTGDQVTQLVQVTNLRNSCAQGNRPYWPTWGLWTRDP